MTDTEQTEREQAAQFEQMGIAFGDDEGLKARASAEPQRMYVERAARCPVIKNQDGSVQLLRMEDMLWVNRSRDVEQASKYLGSNRKAIPLGLDGPEHTKYRRLLDPVFTARRIAPLETNVRELANSLIDSFIDDGEANVNVAWCQPLPSTIFISILGLPREHLDDFMRFKNMTLGIGFPKDISMEDMMRLRVEAAREPDVRVGLASEVDAERIGEEVGVDIGGRPRDTHVRARRDLLTAREHEILHRDAPAVGDGRLEAHELFDRRGPAGRVGDQAGALLRVAGEVAQEAGERGGDRVESRDHQQPDYVVHVLPGELLAAGLRFEEPAKGCRLRDHLSLRARRARG